MNQEIHLNNDQTDVVCKYYKTWKFFLKITDKVDLENQVLISYSYSYHESYRTVPYRVVSYNCMCEVCYFFPFSLLLLSSNPPQPLLVIAIMLTFVLKLVSQLISYHDRPTCLPFSYLTVAPTILQTLF